MENIGLQDSLLSRFDLLFIMLDQMDPEQDREISDHVLRMHQYRAPGEQDGDGECMSSRNGWWEVGSNRCLRAEAILCLLVLQFPSPPLPFTAHSLETECLSTLGFPWISLLSLGSSNLHVCEGHVSLSSWVLAF